MYTILIYISNINIVRNYSILIYIMHIYIWYACTTYVRHILYVYYIILYMIYSYTNTSMFYMYVTNVN